MAPFKIRPIEDRDKILVEYLLTTQWGSCQIVNSFGVKDCRYLPGFID